MVVTRIYGETVFILFFLRHAQKIIFCFRCCVIILPEKSAQIVKQKLLQISRVYTLLNLYIVYVHVFSCVRILIKPFNIELGDNFIESQN